MRERAHVVWRRLDQPGHDACWLVRENGWRLEGASVSSDPAAGPVLLHYGLRCAPDWRTVEGHVEGWIGERRVRHVIAREGASWLLDGAAVEGLQDVEDLDLSFTPATNLTQLKRAALAIGEAISLPVAWLDADRGSLTLLPQTYERRSATRYWYEAPSVDYRGLLELLPSGFVGHYPGLWRAEPGP